MNGAKRSKECPIPLRTRRFVRSAQQILVATAVDGTPCTKSNDLMSAPKQPSAVRTASRLPWHGPQAPTPPACPTTMSAGMRLSEDTKTAVRALHDLDGALLERHDLFALVHAELSSCAREL